MNTYPPAEPASAPRALVACLGNVLCGDDGFGSVVANVLSLEGVPDDVRVLDVGIGGMGMVHDLAEPCEVLVVVDALDLGRLPGTVVVIAPDVDEQTDHPLWARHAELSSAHHTVPERALRVARAVGAPPAQAWLVGCQPANTDRLAVGLTPQVEQAVAVAATEVHRLIEGAPARSTA
ncbi:MAG: hydrogenase maturation protease [Candidatus Dormibacteraeota bacterium]|nr:hydrogenase maturation protease [Candidatus Dormibacteraeota bacterium]